MAGIHIRRTHSLGMEPAKQKVETLAQTLKKELQTTHSWRGNQLSFKRSGASGTIDVGDDYIELDVKLGMALGLMKGKIEESINRSLDRALG